MGGGPKPNSNVPIVDVPKWLRRGGVRPNWDNVLKYGFFFEGIPKFFWRVNVGWKQSTLDHNKIDETF